MNPEKPDRLRTFLDEIGLTPAEATLFNILHYGMAGPPEFLPNYADSRDYHIGGPVSRDERRDALNDCLAKGWLQVIDETALEKIQHDLSKGGYLGPIYGMPSIGHVDFTEAGAERWHRLHAPGGQVQPGVPFAYTDVVACRFASYFRREQAARAAIEEFRSHEDVVSVTGPFPVGPWGVQWWRRFPEGWEIRVEEGRQWWGRAAGEGTSYFLDWSPQKSRWPELQPILGRHNVTLPEWLALVAAEHDRCYLTPASLLHLVAADAKRRYGVVLSEEDCRAGLENCLAYRWLRVVDKQVIREVESLLRNDPVFRPVPVDLAGREGGVDFTPAGASLYRMIAAEWLGPDWEDALAVTQEFYREEHRYCEALAGVEDLEQEYPSAGGVIHSRRIVPIGPWCVYWWERFPAGFRLELEIGAP